MRVWILLPFLLPSHAQDRTNRPHCTLAELEKATQLSTLTCRTNNALLLAIDQNRIALVERLLAQKVDVNQLDKNGATPLHLAARNEKTDLVGRLLGLGADPNRQAQTGWTPLMVAVDAKALGAVDLLCRAGAKAYPPTTVTSELGSRQIPAYQCAPIAKDDLLADAVRNSRYGAALILLRDGAKPSVGKDGRPDLVQYWWALQHAALNEAEKKAYGEALVRSGLDANGPVSEAGETTLTRLLQNANERGELVRRLVALGADPNRADAKGTLPLDVALEYRDAEAVKALIKAGAIPGPNSFLSYGCGDGAKDDIGKLLEESGAKRPTASAMNNSGFEEYKKKNYEKALRYFRCAASLDPKHAISRYNYAATRAIQPPGEDGVDCEGPGEILEKLSEAIRLDPSRKARALKDPDFANLQGLSFFRLLSGTLSLEKTEALHDYVRSTPWYSTTAPAGHTSLPLRLRPNGTYVVGSEEYGVGKYSLKGTTLTLKMKRNVSTCAIEADPKRGIVLKGAAGDESVDFDAFPCP